MTVIRVICQYCHRHIVDKDGQGVAGVIHGICERCWPLPEDTRMHVYRQTVKMERVRDLVNIWGCT